VRYLSQPNVREGYFRSGAEVVASPPEAMAATMKPELERIGRVIKAAGIRAE
jgi:tripartite-type tricarboxylate transporter receptor subunit TctC